MRAGADLVVPVTCGGCGRAGRHWCARCARRLSDTPIECVPRVSPHVPVWALGRYRGPHRHAVIALKEHGRRDLAEPLGLALARAITTLARWAELPDAARLLVVPAPTRRLAARRRGGDPVLTIARHAAEALGAGVRLQPTLMIAAGTRDSAGLDARERARNLRGAVRPSPSARAPGADDVTIVVDDVLTTGATVAESVRVLTTGGHRVAAAVVIAVA